MFFCSTDPYSLSTTYLMQLPTHILFHLYSPLFKVFFLSVKTLFYIISDTISLFPFCATYSMKRGTFITFLIYNYLFYNVWRYRAKHWLLCLLRYYTGCTYVVWGNLGKSRIPSRMKKRLWSFTCQLFTI